MTLRLPRSHSGDAASARKRSPPGGSTLTTSAPKSASTIVAIPPTGPVVASTTRTPCNTSGTAATVLAGPSAAGAGAPRQVEPVRMSDSSVWSDSWSSFAGDVVTARLAVPFVSVSDQSVSDCAAAVCTAHPWPVASCW